MQKIQEYSPLYGTRIRFPPRPEPGNGFCNLLSFEEAVRARARDKGIAVSELISRFPMTDLVVYIGDDKTDEDVFQKLSGYGHGVKVGADPGETAAGFFLPDVVAVGEFLRRWDRETRLGKKGDGS